MNTTTVRAADLTIRHQIDGLTVSSVIGCDVDKVSVWLKTWKFGELVERRVFRTDELVTVTR